MYDLCFLIKYGSLNMAFLKFETINILFMTQFDVILELPYTETIIPPEREKML